MQRTLLTALSIEFDAVVVAAGTTPTGDIKLVTLLQEAFRHCKPLAGWGDGVAVLASAGISGDEPGRPGGNVYSIRDGRNQGYAPATINRRLAAISGVFAFRQMRDQAAHSPIPGGRAARLGSRGRGQSRCRFRR